MIFFASLFSFQYLKNIFLRILSLSGYLNGNFLAFFFLDAQPFFFRTLLAGSATVTAAGRAVAAVVADGDVWAVLGANICAKWDMAFNLL